MKKLQACVLPLMAAVLSVLAFHGLNFMLLLGGFSIIYLVWQGATLSRAALVKAWKKTSILT